MCPPFKNILGEAAVNLFSVLLITVVCMLALYSLCHHVTIAPVISAGNIVPETLAIFNAR
jgi:hypothetical protein